MDSQQVDHPRANPKINGEIFLQVIMKTIALSFLCLLAITAKAEGWTSSVGYQHLSSKSQLDSNPSSGSFDSLSLSLTKKLDQRTFVGGSIAYNTGDTVTYINRGTFDHRATSGAVFVVHDLGHGFLADASLGYGGIQLNGNYLGATTPTQVQADSAFWMAGAGLTRLMPLTSSLVATFSARVNYSISKTDDYIDSVGASQTGTRGQRTGVSLGGGMTWILGALTPSVNINYQHSNRGYLAGVQDKEYLSYSLGVGYALSPKHSLSVGYAGVASKKFSSEKSLSASVSSQF